MAFHAQSRLEVDILDMILEFIVHWFKGNNNLLLMRVIEKEKWIREGEKQIQSRIY